MSAPTLMARHDADLHPSPPEGQVRVGSPAEPRSGRAALDTAHRRLLFLSACFAIGFSVIGVRLVDLATSKPEAAPKLVERDVPPVVRAREKKAPAVMCSPWKTRSSLSARWRSTSSEAKSNPPNTTRRLE